MRSMTNLFVISCAAALLFVAGCGGGSSHSTSTTPPPSGANVQSITVNSGPTLSYGNGAFTSVTICPPGSSNCQTISGILVDTGSIGLRILASALTIALPQQTASNSDPIVECYAFVSGYTWGFVQTADIQISGEQASSAPIQVIGGNTPTVPSQCSSMAPEPSNTLASLGANGILGIGQYPQDCGTNCPTNIYYQCPSSGCVGISQPVAQQLPNPVTLFPTDNNGVIIELPAVTTPQVSITGSLVFGIGTESNNGLNGATVYSVNQDGYISTVFNGSTYNQTFLDSGSNGIYFLGTSQTSIPVCPSPESAFYCPSSTQNLSATNQGANGTSEQVTFSVVNADTMFDSAPSGTAVYPDLAGPNSTFSGFDWGLPFFYGRNVYTGIESATAAPYWAF
jgi:hypothetical protein